MQKAEYVIYIYNVYIGKIEQMRTKLEQIGGTVFYGFRYVKTCFALVGAVLEPLRYVSRFVLMSVPALFCFSNVMLQCETKREQCTCINAIA